MKAIFTTKVSPGYDDLPEIRYHFPKTYLRQAAQAVGDWVIYYEPRRSSPDLMSRGGRQAYFATALLERIVPDPVREDHYYAEVSNFLEFVRAVPFTEGALYYEESLRKADGSTNKGAFGRSVRTITNAEYDLIWRAGFGHVLGLEARERTAPDAPEEPSEPLPIVAEERGSFDYDLSEQTDRAIVLQLVSRPFRDRAFAAAVKQAYRDTCAVTGLKIINGGGRSEVQAAHIRSVQQQGPDSVRNGIALSGTAHWMFDRGLISVADDYSILVAERHLPEAALRLLNAERRLSLPERAELRPHSRYLAHHRQTCFKG